MVVLNGERVWFDWATDCANSYAGQVGEAYGEQQRQGCIRYPGLLTSCLGGMECFDVVCYAFVLGILDMPSPVVC